MNGNQSVKCSLCGVGRYPSFGYSGIGVCDHCGTEWTYSEGDTITEKSLRLLWSRRPRWIPVSEQLPPPEELPYDSRPRLSVEVLAAYQFADGSYEKELAHYDYDLGQWWDYRDKWHWAPTHWMPLPKDPEQKQ